MSIRNPYFIVNPKSGGGRAEKLWPILEQHIQKMFGKCSVVFTQKPGDATRHARLASEKGQTRLVAVGGDGTVHELVNGIMQTGEKCRKRVVLGVISMGSGDDYVKSLSLPKDPLEALRTIQKNRLKKVDVIQVDFTNHQHKKESRFCMNLADFGLGGRVMQKVNSSHKIMGSKLTYLFHALSTFLTFSPFSVVLENEDRNYHFHQLMIGLIANGKYFGSGMCVAPEAKLDDGKMDLIMVEKMGVRDFFKMLPDLYRGEKINSDKIMRIQSGKFYVQSTSDKPVYIELDGEQPGVLPASFELIPKALTLCV